MRGGAPPPVAARPAAIPPAAPTIPAPSASIFPLFGGLVARLTGAGCKGGTGVAGVAFATSPVILGCFGGKPLLLESGLFPPLGTLVAFVRARLGPDGGIIAVGGADEAGADMSLATGGTVADGTAFPVLFG